MSEKKPYSFVSKEIAYYSCERYLTDEELAQVKAETDPEKRIALVNSFDDDAEYKLFNSEVVDLYLDEDEDEDDEGEELSLSGFD